jgi:hypothetical protein
LVYGRKDYFFPLLPNLTILNPILFSWNSLTKLIFQNLFFFFRPSPSFALPATPNHLLLDSASNLGPLISRLEMNRFENCWYKSIRILEVLKLLFQQFLNFSSSQQDMSGPRLRALPNNRWSGDTCFRKTWKKWTPPFSWDVFRETWFARRDLWDIIWKWSPPFSPDVIREWTLQECTQFSARIFERQIFAR